MYSILDPSGEGMSSSFSCTERNGTATSPRLPRNSFITRTSRGVKASRQQQGMEDGGGGAGDKGAVLGSGGAILAVRRHTRA